MTEDQNPAAIGASIATSLIAQAVRGGETDPGFWETIDKVRDGDHVREVLVALASMTAEFVHVIAGLRHEPVEQVLDYVAGCVSETIAETEEEG